MAAEDPDTDIGTGALASAVAACLMGPVVASPGIGTEAAPVEGKLAMVEELVDSMAGAALVVAMKWCLWCLPR